jgi:hypothetical protein
MRSAGAAEETAYAKALIENATTGVTDLDARLAGQVNAVAAQGTVKLQSIPEPEPTKVVGTEAPTTVELPITPVAVPAEVPVATAIRRRR